MAPLDWDRLMALNIEELEDEDTTNDMYDALSEFEVGDETDVEKIKKLFLVTQAVMVSKGVAAEVFEEHMTQLKTDEGKSLTKKVQQIEELKLEVQSLKKKNRDLERSGGGDPSSIRTVETKHLNDLNFELENQVAQLHGEIREKEAQLEKEKRNSEEYMTQADEANRRLRELKIENDQLREDVIDLRRQLEAQRDTMLSRREGDMEAKDRIQQKNVLLNAALDENRNLAEQNNQLEEELNRLQQEMREGREEIEKTTDEYLKIKNMMDLNDRAMDTVSRENKMLKAQVEDLLAQIKTKSEADDEIMNQVDVKVQEWKVLLADKDDRILDLQRQVVTLREKLTAANMDTDKQSLVLLSKAVEDKDKQIEALTKRLNESVADIDDNTKLIDDVRSRVMHSGVGGSDATRRRITTLQQNIQQLEEQLVDMEKRTSSAEEDARLKDKDLNELMEKQSLYEQGIYGLPEAITEIKQAKIQVRERDRNIEELTQYINRCEAQMNELYDEAEELRERLGLDPREPINLTEIRHKKTIRLQQDRALNRVLQKEIEKLEEERIELKQQLRKVAQNTGQKAVAMGLTADQVAAVDSFIEQIKLTNDLTPSKSILQSLKADLVTDDKRIRNRVLVDDTEKSAKRINALHEECTELRTKNKELEEENELLEKGLRDIKDQVSRAGGKGGSETLNCPALDKMLQALESRSVIGRYDKSVILKAQVDNLTGRNEELRRELKEQRVELLKAQDMLSKATDRKENLELELKSFRETGGGGLGGWIQFSALPEGMAASSAEIISALNEHLIVSLQELSNKEALIEKMQENLESYRRKYTIIRHQQGLLYQDYAAEKKRWESSEQTMKKELSEALGAKEEDQVRIQEFDRLLDTLAQDEPEVRRRLSEMSRKMTVLRVNEKALTRRYTAMLEIEAALRKDNVKLKADIVSQQKAIAERLGYLQRHKDMVAFKIAGLQKALEDSVPSSQLEQANKQYTELTEKYRSLLDSSQSLVSVKEHSSELQIEVRRLQDENNMLKKELQTDREKLHTLEATYESLRSDGTVGSGRGGGGGVNSQELVTLAQRLATIEMKEMNERQKADHASRMYEQQKETLRHLEDRNFELESKFSELTKINLEHQKVERELRDELSQSVLKSVSDKDRERIFELEQTEASLRNEVSKLKEVSDVATMQVQEIQMQQQSHEKELTSLRQQLLDIQCQSDEKTVIGKLHRHIIQLQVSEATAVRRYEETVKRLAKLEAQSLRLEQRVDEKDQTIYHNRLESRNKQNHLRKTIQDLRRKYAGAVPLSDQEKFAHLMVKLSQDQIKIEEDMRKTREDRDLVEDKLAELKLKHKGLEELMATLKDGRGAQKVADWHSKMEALRLEDLRYKREIDKLKRQIKFLEAIQKTHEAEVLTLEEEKVRLHKEYESNELEWEQREVELERRVLALEKQQAEIAGAASEFEDAIGTLPDSSLPLVEQLDHAVMTIKRNVKLILDAKASAQANKKRADDLEIQIRDKDKEVLTRDRIITDLKLRLPLTADRDQMISRLITKHQSAVQSSTVIEDDPSTSHAVQIAQSTISNLQNQSAVQSSNTIPDVPSISHAVQIAQSTISNLLARLAHKDETIAQYQQLLQQAHDEMTTAIRRHEEETKQLRQQLQSRNQSAFKQFKAHMQESMKETAGRGIPSTSQLKQINELEDQLAEKDNKTAALRDKLRLAQHEIEEWKLKHDLALRKAADEVDSAKRGHETELQNEEEKRRELERELQAAREEIDVQIREVESQKEKNQRAPSVTMKNTVERLTAQLAQKESQLKTMSKTLLDLRADMVSLAENGVKAKGELDANELNVKKLVDKRTKELTDRLEELDAINKKQKAEIKKMKEMEIELQQATDNLGKRDAALKKLKEEKEILSTENAELQHKIQRMGTMSKQKAETEGFYKEMEDLRRRNRSLTDQLDKLKIQPEKPYEQQGVDGREKKDSALAKWNEIKKWERKVELLKNRVREKDGEIERLNRANEHMKGSLDRVSKEKETMDLRSRSTGPEARTQVSMLGAGAGSAGAHLVQDLKKQNHELRDEIASLRRQLMMGKDAAYEEVQMRNQFLTDKLQQLEQNMSHRQSAVQQQQHRERGVEYRDLAVREDQLQKQVLKLNEENMELRFEVEQANKDIPRLKGRIEDLQKYVDVLKAEKAQLEMMAKSRDSLSGISTPSSNIRRIGESGRSAHELEKTIALLKKVVEKTQQENERLKSGAPSSALPGNQALVNENQALKDQLEELRSKFGATLTDRYNVKEKGTNKIMNDYEKVRKDLVKEIDNNEKLRVRLTEVENLLDEKNRELDSKRTELDSERARKSSLGAMDARAYKSVVHARMSDDRIKSLEEELDRKAKLVTDAKQLVKESAAREQQLIYEKEELEKKITLLQNFPPGAKVSDAELSKNYQLARLKIDRLENEKKELLHELQTLRKRVNPSAGGPNDVSEDEILAKMRAHDRIMADNVDLNMKVKMLQLDKTKLQQEIEKLKRELSNYGPEFMGEMEDLRFNYMEAMKKNTEYENQLRSFGRQFGVAVPGL